MRIGERSLTRYGHRVKYKINGKRVLRSRYVMEQKLGRPLKPTEIVHHKDENANNDDPDNLVLYKSRAAHTKKHSSKRRTRPETAVCPTCLEEFIYPKKGRRVKYCSQECYYRRGPTGPRGPYTKRRR